MSKMHDSGERQAFDSGAVRDTAAGKSRPDLISPFAMIRLGDWLRLGAEKYSERNWEAGIPFTRCIASLYRHLLAYQMGKTDEDHLAAIMCNAMFLAHYEAGIKYEWLPDSLDDRPRYESPDLPGFLDSKSGTTGNMFLGQELTAAEQYVQKIVDEARPDQTIVYVSGPMRGHKDFNFPAFDAASTELRTLGYQIISPADVDRVGAKAEENDLLRFVRRDFFALYLMAQRSGPSMLVTLPGWQNSTGASAEVMLAQWLKIPMAEFYTLLNDPIIKNRRNR